ncbi:MULTISPECIES: zinc ABC transporter substrate-binding protein [unclassified Brevibacterium]|uniref:metal ABC transporter solute-binding protein, Zn/Mn family n=1 Tax=unclassified Brevibacterium TaxID=2614124 RepID=UPI001128F207|nr:MULTISPECIES: zinc ABC transporter substrate-binding protein [unclassified Brevibacterium]MCM1013693.1 zinc ABC transporter substrate-binding protein [Brevibacterium sp. XM4083]
MRLSRLPLRSGAILLSCGLLLAGCGGGSATGSSELSIVTSTNVYADIVSQVAGDAASVTAIIDDPNQDPHSYEATTRDRLKLSKADLVVINGGGYDSFMTTMLEASDATPEIIDVVAISGLPGSEDVSSAPHSHGDGEDESAGGEHTGHTEADGHDADGDSHEGHDHGEAGHEGHDHGEFNEHLWYSVPTMVRLVDDVAVHLGEALPDRKDDIAANAEAYKEQLGGLETTIDAIRTDHGGEKVATTEPVPLWLFDDMGLDNITSPEFLAAVEEGNDVPPLVLKDAEEQISSREAVLLGYNTQAAGPQAEQLKATAESSDVPVVDLAETMPAGVQYTDWIGESIDAISQALEGHDH